MVAETVVIKRPPRIQPLTPAEQQMMNYFFELSYDLQQVVNQLVTVAAGLPEGFNPALLIDPDDATIATAQGTANAAYTLAAAAQTAAAAAQTTATAAAVAVAALTIVVAGLTAKLAAIAAVLPYAGSITNPVTGTEGTAINAVPTAIIAAAA